MKTFDEMLKLEKEYAEPSPAEVKQLRRHLVARLGGALLPAVSILGIPTSAWAISIKALLFGGLVATVAGGFYRLNDPEPTKRPSAAHQREKVELPPPERPLEQEKSDAQSAKQVPQPPGIPLSTPPQKTTRVEQPSPSPQWKPSETRSKKDEPPAAASTRQQDRFEEDLQTLRTVSRALNSGQAQAALTLLNRYSSKQSELRSEFLAARAIALCQLGRTAEAQPLVESLSANSSGSPLIRRVRSACD